MQFHPALAGPNKSAKLSVVTYDLNRAYVDFAQTTLSLTHSLTPLLVPHRSHLHLPISA